MAITTLQGLRVVDLSDDVAGAYAARWLGALGADVVKVEPPEGDPTRRLGPRRDDTGETSALFAYLNTGKRSLVLDTAADADRAPLISLLERADVVIETGAPGAWAARGIDVDGIRAAHPAQVVCSITPFGQDGPRAGWKMTALTAAAAGGQLMLCGDPAREPLKTAGYQAYTQAALHAFSSIVTALFAARRDGAGDHLDISMQEAQAASLEAAGPNAMVRGIDTERAGNQARAVWGIYPCADGFVGVAAMPRQTGSVYQCIQHPELLDSPVLMDLTSNPEGNEVASALITEWTMSHSAQEIFDISHGYRAPFSLIATPAQLLEWEPLVRRGFWKTIDHPVLGRHAVPDLPFSLDGERGAFGRAPLLGEHTEEVLREIGATPPPPPTPVRDRRRPLEGIRVLDLTQVWAGPYATRFLADMGADVVHIEGPSFPDAVRGVGRGPDPRQFNKTPYFNDYNRNKRGLALDLHRPEGIEAFRELAKTADVVMENWSVGVSERLGIGYADLRALNPRIVMVQMPGFAQDPPESERVGFGPTIEQMGGLVSLQGYEGEGPHKSGISYGDPTAGIAAAGATALALLQRETTGEGAHIVIYQRDNIIGMVGEYLVAESLGIEYPVRIGNRDPQMAPHGVYRTRDDAGRWAGDVLGNPTEEYHDTWLALAVDGDDAWRALRACLDDPRLSRPEYDTAAGRLAAQREIDAVLAELLRERDPTEVATALQAAGVSAMPVMSALMLVRDEHLAARGYFPTVLHPEAGEHVTTHPVWRWADRPQPPLQPAPCFGEHNRDVLAAAGYTEDRIASMEAAGILATVPLKA
ncbi:MAG: CaiB/BaiF CoA transferase family protein [Dehalococcoidia bacterium]